MFDATSDMNNFNSIYRYFLDLINVDVSDYESGLQTLILPVVPESIFRKLIDKVSLCFQRENSLLKLNMDIIVIGDLHGHILDLFRILKKFGPPPQRNYLFLGDIIDRGEFSIETLVLIYVMKVLYPHKVYIIRGNHEFKDLCTHCGFTNELRDTYNSINLENDLMDSFDHIPLAAVVNNKTLCVHGGIGPELTNIQQIAQMNRPIRTFNDEFTESLVWSDPSQNNEGFVPSSRGSGYFYGEDVLKKFLSENNIDVLVRGHECIDSGVLTLFDKKLVTVFSASNYCGVTPNNSGVLTLYQYFDRKEATIFAPLKYLYRSRAHFLYSQRDNVFSISQDMINKIQSKSLPLLVNKSLETFKLRPATGIRPLRPPTAYARLEVCDDDLMKKTSRDPKKRRGISLSASVKKISDYRKPKKQLFKAFEAKKFSIIYS